MIAALDSMTGVEDRAVYIARAAAANQRFVAFFIRHRAELLADDYRRRGGYVRFVSLSGYPFVETRDHRIVMLAPIDALSWTAQTAAGFGEITADRRRVDRKARGELRLTGRATALAKRQLKREGWRVLERQ